MKSRVQSGARAATGVRWPPFVLAALTAIFAGCPADRQRSREPEVVVLVAASAQNALHEVAELFENQTGTSVTIVPGPSNGLARQILAGAAGDVFLSANRQWAEAVMEKGLGVRQQPLLSNRLVIIVPSGNPARVQGPEDLTRQAVQHVALAGENVPAGLYAEQSLRKLGVYDELRMSRKIVHGHDVRQTLTYVERREADAGIVYATDAALSSGVQVAAELDPGTHQEIVYPVVLLERGDRHPAAARFFDFLRSADAAAVFKRFGFAIASDRAAARLHHKALPRTGNHALPSRT